MLNNQDKQYWCKKAVEDEKAFVNRLQAAGYDARINPDKTGNKFAPDLIVDGRLGDYKHETTPFFTANRYNISADNAYSFNTKDYNRYRELYPDLDIWVHLEWPEQTNYGVTVVRSNRVYCVPFTVLCEKIESNQAPLHIYQQRAFDEEGNARHSFIFDTTWFEQFRKGKKSK